MKKNVKKDIIFIGVLIAFLLLILIIIIINNKEEKKPEVKNDIQEQEEDVVDKFPGYTLYENPFGKDTNTDLKVLFDKEDIGVDDIRKISNSMVNGYVYLLEIGEKGTVNIKDLNNEELVRLSLEFFYTTQEKICTSVEFLDELMFKLFGDIEINIESIEENYNEYSDSYCIERKRIDSLYSLEYYKYDSVQDYLVFTYRKKKNNIAEGIVKVYFRNNNGSYYLEKIDL